MATLGVGISIEQMHARHSNSQGSYTSSYYDESGGSTRNTGYSYGSFEPRFDKQDSIGKSHVILYTLVFTAITILLIFAYAFVTIKTKKDSHIDTNAVLIESPYME